jgi:hypothetical protein
MAVSLLVYGSGFWLEFNTIARKGQHDKATAITLASNGALEHCLGDRHCLV